MAFYEARIEPPPSRFIDALREYGAAEIILTIEAPGKRDAAYLLSQSCSEWWGRYGAYEEDWFEDRLRVLRGVEALAAEKMLTA